MGEYRCCTSISDGRRARYKVRPTVHCVVTIHSGGSAIIGLSPLRPVALRPHFSVGLPFSELTYCHRLFQAGADSQPPRAMIFIDIAEYVLVIPCIYLMCSVLAAQKK